MIGKKEALQKSGRWNNIEPCRIRRAGWILEKAKKLNVTRKIFAEHREAEAERIERDEKRIREEKERLAEEGERLANVKKGFNGKSTVNERSSTTCKFETSQREPQHHTKKTTDGHQEKK
ncbi:unnamed protein product [Caenorhabditis nigoni]